MTASARWWLLSALLSVLACTTPAADQRSNSGPPTVRARPADEFAYCDPADEKTVPRNEFHQPGSVRYVVLELRPSSEQAPEVGLGRRAADELHRLLRDHLLDVVAEDATPEDRRAIAQAIEIVRLRCVVQDDYAARDVGTAMGADVVLWGEASSAAFTPSGAPLVEVINNITQSNEASNGGTAGVGSQNITIAPVRSDVVKQLTAFTQGSFRIHAALTSQGLMPLRSRRDERVVADQLESLELPQIVGGDTYCLVVSVAGVHYYRQSEYSRALRFFRRAAEKLPVDAPSAVDLLWISGDTEMRAGRFQAAAAFFEIGLAHAAPGSWWHWSHRVSLIDALVQLNETARANSLAMAALEALRGDAAQDPDASVTRGMALNNLSSRLSDLGRREEALATIARAVEIRRRLARTRPEAFEPDLAISLNNLSVNLSDLGRREEALATNEGAIEVCRRLAKARPEAFEPYLAGALNNLSNRLSDLGRHKEALAAIEGAVEILRRLAKARPEAFEPDLAMSLNNLSGELSDLGRREEALSAIEGAVEIRRRLAKARPEAFEPYLAGALNNLSRRLADLGRPDEALAAIEGAVEVYRRLAEARPEAFEPDLAMSLNNRSNCLGDLGRREEALVVIEEAVELYRRLAKARPEVFELYLAGALNNLSLCLADVGRREEALVAMEEAVELYRRLAKARPVVFNRDLADSLNDLSRFFADMGRTKEAEAAQREAAALSSDHP